MSVLFLIFDTLAVARSNLIERMSRRAKSRRPYRKAGDDELLALIRRLVDERPSYGYRRIRRLINRQRKADGKPPVNGKRVLRIMQANKLTLERHTGRRPGRTHDGVVIALRSNIRWCSDHFELACRNGEIVRVLFAIEACDREVMAWLATSAGISGEMVRDLMVACVERHGISKAKVVIVCINCDDQNRFEITVSVLNKNKFWHLPARKLIDKILFSGGHDDAEAPPPWSVEELDACFVEIDSAGQQNSSSNTGSGGAQPVREPGKPVRYAPKLFDRTCQDHWCSSPASFRS